MQITHYYHNLSFELNYIVAHIVYRVYLTSFHVGLEVPI